MEETRLLKAEIRRLQRKLARAELEMTQIAAVHEG